MPIYLDNAATSYPKPEEVYQAVDTALREGAGSPGRGGHRGGISAARLVLEARETLAHLFGVADSSRLVFTHSATESLNLALHGLLNPGDHVVTTSMEHNSMARPLHLASRRGVEVTWVEAGTDGFVSPEDLAAAVRPNTALIAVSHCSNVTGTIQAVSLIGEIARNAGIPFLVDAAQSAGCIPIDVGSMHIDMLAAPGHKGLMGPPGTGFLYIADGVSLQPLLVGGTGTSSASLDQPETLPERFESGTQNTPAIAGLLAGAGFVSSVGVANIAAHEAALVVPLMEGLRLIPGLKVYGPDPSLPRGSVVSFAIDGMDPSQVGFVLDHDYEIAVRTGLHCAPNAHRSIGTYPSGTIRVSPGWFNTGSEIATFLDAIDRIARRKR
ncbi:aminotransferase class V-fold PLP-dependent enzyme [Geobacter pelophilus]|uniref:cysteine desulfurase n=1 Tax=Geoanaerobacter pelophilus TaxID=60036 RepID=A0AAW4L411_9BACT|nr:aminotransferase class V-fold PLP-dependent enzyme [Geoanaerobacter pelophilus]MBT0665703.1 aminotransferase class V-fold PLP-dependent enzyme [Geoanaerobacter pelophilus]